MAAAAEVVAAAAAAEEESRREESVRRRVRRVVTTAGPLLGIWGAGRVSAHHAHPFCRRGDGRRGCSHQDYGRRRQSSRAAERADLVTASSHLANGLVSMQAAVPRGVRRLQLYPRCILHLGCVHGWTHDCDRTGIGRSQPWSVVVWMMPAVTRVISYLTCDIGVSDLSATARLASQRTRNAQSAKRGRRYAVADQAQGETIS